MEGNALSLPHVSVVDIGVSVVFSSLGGNDGAFPSNKDRAARGVKVITSETHSSLSLRTTCIHSKNSLSEFLDEFVQQVLHALLTTTT